MTAARVLSDAEAYALAIRVVEAELGGPGIGTRSPLIDARPVREVLRLTGAELRAEPDQHGLARLLAQIGALDDVRVEAVGLPGAEDLVITRGRPARPVVCNHDVNVARNRARRTFRWSDDGALWHDPDTYEARLLVGLQVRDPSPLWRSGPIA